MKKYDYSNIPNEFYQKIEFENIKSVEDILGEIRKDGDAALKKYSKLFDNCERESFLITKEEIDKAFELVDDKIIVALNYAIENIKNFASKQLASLKELKTEVDGNILGHKIVPLNTVGCYIPGGNYPLPSTALMTIVPAKVAGVKKVVACSPKIQPLTIAACKLAGADEIYCTGGVQAIGAMAYGTCEIPKVDKIVGPGNKYVTAAKKYVYGECGIDFLAGPSEVLIIADETANPKYVAADMLAQCEHDKDARAYLIAFSDEFIQKVDACANEFLKTLKTADIANVAYEKSIAVKVNSLDEAVNISNLRAPEHLELCFKDCENLADKFTNYGSLFVGSHSAEVFGDYASGTNHTLPTNQVARYSGGLSVFNYIKVQTYQVINPNTSDYLKKASAILAHSEGLEAHALAAEVRIENN